jgi:hypothetical protein
MATKTKSPVTDASDYEEAQASNADLEHSEGGTTTRDDATDMGVPMLPGSADEPQGPEDALGPGPKRGDYSKRLGDANYQPHEVVANPDAKEGEPTVVAVPQAPRASDQGEVAGEKGGVTTG